jgi:transposase
MLWAFSSSKLFLGEEIMVCVGLDIHKRYITACVLNAHGEVVGENRKLPPDAAAVLAFLSEFGGSARIAIEATLYWSHLTRRLTASGHEVVVTHPHHVKLIWATQKKTDPIDARKLAELLRAGLLPAIWIPDPETEAQRQLLRGRVFIVRQRTVIRNRIHACLTMENLRAPVLDAFTRAGREWLSVVELTPVLRREVELLLEAHDLLSDQVKALNREIRSKVRCGAAAQSLLSVPGVGEFGALVLQAEIGTIDRFRSAQDLAAYAGLVPSTHSSGGRTRHGRTGRGNPWLKWILVEAVQTHKKTPGPVRDYYIKLLRSKGKQKATVAAARKLCTYIYWMLKRGWSYSEWLRQHDRPEVLPRLELGSAA